MGEDSDAGQDPTEVEKDPEGHWGCHGGQVGWVVFQVPQPFCSKTAPPLPVELCLSGELRHFDCKLAGGELAQVKSDFVWRYGVSQALGGLEPELGRWPETVFLGP